MSCKSPISNKFRRVKVSPRKDNEADVSSVSHLSFALTKS